MFGRDSEFACTVKVLGYDPMYEIFAKAEQKFQASAVNSIVTHFAIILSLVIVRRSHP